MWFKFTSKWSRSTKCSHPFIFWTNGNYFLCVTDLNSLRKIIRIFIYLILIYEFFYLRNSLFFFGRFKWVFWGKLWSQKQIFLHQWPWLSSILQDKQQYTLALWFFRLYQVDWRVWLLSHINKMILTLQTKQGADCVSVYVPEWQHGRRLLQLECSGWNQWNRLFQYGKQKDAAKHHGSMTQPKCWQIKGLPSL